MSTQSTAASIAPPSSPASTTSDSTKLYEEGCTLLRNGHKFNVAIADLRKATALQPKDPQIHAALGCALTDRALSIYYTEYLRIHLPWDRYVHQRMLEAWNKAQEKPSDPLYGSPAPIEPELRTRDDNAPYGDSPEESVRITEILGKEAESEIKLAISLAKTDKERANYLYTQGWSKTLLRQFRANLPSILLTRKASGKSPSDDKPDLTTTELPDLSPDNRIIEIFKQALSLDENNSRYWQSLGDAYLAIGFKPLGKSRTHINEAIAAYNNALLSKAQNKAALWYQIASLHIEGLKLNIFKPDNPDFTNLDGKASFVPSESSDDAELLAALAALKKAIASDSSNSALWYIAAGIGMEQQRRSPANGDDSSLDNIMSIIENGNNAGYCEPVIYKPEIPPLLAFTGKWLQGINDRYNYPLSIVQFAGNTAANFCLKTIFSQNDDGRIERYSKAAIAMNLKIAEHSA